MYNTMLKLRMIHKKTTLPVVLLLLLMSMLSIPVRAADFVHSHTDGCYSMGYSKCTARHESSTRNDKITSGCGNCGTSTEHTRYVNWDHCFGISADFEMGGRHVCDRCGAENYHWGGGGTKEHDVMQNLLTCGKDKAVLGVLWMKNRTPEWTAGTVLLQAGVTVKSSGFALAGKPYSWDRKATWSTKDTIEVSENGKYTVYAASAEGKVVGEALTVNNIDRTGPVLTEIQKSETDWTNQAVTVTIEGRDVQEDGTQGCGMAELPYSYDGGASFTAENSFTVSDNDCITVIMQDKLGNRGQGEVAVTNIDRMPPQVTGVGFAEEGWQREQITIHIEAEDAEGGCGLHTEAYSLDGETWQPRPDFVLTENGDYTAYVRDALGNRTEFAFSVDMLDRTPPSITGLNTQDGRISEDRVTVTVCARDMQPDGREGCGLHEKAYSYDSGKSWVKSRVFTIKEGEIVRLVVRDALLNESKVKTIRRSDFPYPPKEEETEPDAPVPEAEPDTEEEPEPESEEDPEPEIPIEEESKEEEAKPLQPFKGKTEAGRLPRNQAKEELPVRIMTEPWYATPAGIALLTGIGVLFLAGVFFLLWLLLFSVPVYCMENTQRAKRLGRVLLHRQEGGYYVFLPDFILRNARTSRYRIRVGRFALKRLENARILIESEEGKTEECIRETIDFTF